MPFLLGVLARCLRFPPPLDRVYIIVVRRNRAPDSIPSIISCNSVTVIFCFCSESQSLWVAIRLPSSFDLRPYTVLASHFFLFDGQSEGFLIFGIYVVVIFVQYGPFCDLLPGF